MYNSPASSSQPTTQPLIYTLGRKTRQQILVHIWCNEKYGKDNRTK